MIWHGRHLGSRLRSRGSRSVAAGRDIDCRLVLPRARYRGNRQDSQSYAVNWHFTAPPGTHKRLEGQQGRVEQPLQGPLYSAGRTVQSIGTGSGGGDSRQGRRAVHFRRSQAAINQSIDQSINRSIDQSIKSISTPAGQTVRCPPTTTPGLPPLQLAQAAHPHRLFPTMGFITPSVGWYMRDSRLLGGSTPPPPPPPRPAAGCATGAEGRGPPPGGDSPANCVASLAAALASAGAPAAAGCGMPAVRAIVRGCAGVAPGYPSSAAAPADAGSCGGPAAGADVG